MPVPVRTLESVEDVRALEPLIREYFGFVCGEIERLFGVSISPESEVERALAHAEDVLPPRGKGFVVERRGAPAGMVFIRPAGAETFEIKRLYVSPYLRGNGAGRTLVEHGVEAARTLGARRIVLDSSKNLEDAARLYRSLGFDFFDPYEASDHGGGGPLTPHMIFMEKWLD